MKKMFFSAVFFKETPQGTDNRLSKNQNKQLYKMLYFANNAIHESGGEPPLSLIWHWAKYGFCTPTKCRRLYTSESEFGGISKGRASRANCGKQNFKRGLTNGAQRCIMEEQWRYQPFRTLLVCAAGAAKRHVRAPLNPSLRSCGKGVRGKKTIDNLSMVFFLFVLRFAKCLRFE